MTFRTPITTQRPGRGTAHRRRRPGTAHCRIRAIASARDEAEVWNNPRTADVVVREPGLRIPRIAMHRCSASITTITPCGSSLRTSASATCAVIRSCTCGRRAYRSTNRAILRQPGDPAVPARDVADVGDAVEREQVVLAEARHRDVADQHQFAVILVEGLSSTASGSA